MHLIDGIKIRDLDDVIKMLSKPTPAKALEHKIFIEKTVGSLESFENIVIDVSLRWFSDTLKLVCVPSEILNRRVLLAHIYKMLEDPMLVFQMEEPLYMKQIEEIKNRLEIDIDDHGDIEEEHCYIGIWVGDHEADRFKGIYTGIPKELLIGPLNPHMTYDCHTCLDSIRVENGDIPDYYYNKRGHHICPECIKTGKYKGLYKHVGEK